MRTAIPEHDAARLCPYCRYPLKGVAEAECCDGCQALHHVECWEENSGCAVVGCGQVAASTELESPPPPDASGRIRITPDDPPPPPPPLVTDPDQGSLVGPAKGRWLVVLVLVLVVVGGVAAYFLMYQGNRADVAAVSNDGSTTSTVANESTSPGSDGLGVDEAPAEEKPVDPNEYVESIPSVSGEGNWTQVAMLASFETAKGAAKEAERIREVTGVPAKILDSSLYPGSLDPGYWVIYAGPAGERKLNRFLQRTRELTSGAKIKELIP